MFITIATAAIAGAVTITQTFTYPPRRMSANAVGAFSQAQSENRVYRSGKPAGAIFISGDGDSKRKTFSALPPSMTIRWVS
jgi:hypothetical protein